jgi:hypothetical protein
VDVGEKMACLASDKLQKSAPASQKATLPARADATLLFDL